jgi:Transposase
MGPAYLKSVTAKAPNVIVCIDPFHVVKLVTDALDQVRRQVWNQLRTVDPAQAKKFKGARWVLLKRPERLTDTQAATLRKLRRHGGAAWRAYGLKEPCGRSSPATLPQARQPGCSTAGAPRPAAAAWRRSSPSLVRSASTARGSSPRSGWGSTTPASRRSTTRSGSSPVAPTGSTPPRPHSRWCCSPAAQSPSASQTSKHMFAHIQVANHIHVILPDPGSTSELAHSRKTPAT